MGVNYDQYCLVGIEVEEESCRKVLKPAEYETQNRYNPRTGEVTHQEKVLVREEEYVYEFNGKEYDDYFYSFVESVASENDLRCAVDQESGFGVVGFSLGDSTDYGRADLLTGSESIKRVLDLVDRLKEIFPDHEVSIHFVTNVG